MFWLSSPIWLVGLIPWSGLVLWLLWGKRKRVDIPFIDLWKGPVLAHSKTRALRLPPIGVSAAILGVLLALLATSQPRFKRAGQSQPITIIVDRGITMSARGKSVERFRETIDLAVPVLLREFGSGPVHLIAIPGGQTISTTRDELRQVAASLKPTAVDSKNALHAEIKRQLQEISSPIVVVTDQKTELEPNSTAKKSPNESADELQTNSRVVFIPPQTTPSNVGIIQVAARAEPMPQIMVRVRNQSSLSRAGLRISVNGTEAANLSVQLPASNGEQNYFLDLPPTTKLDNLIKAELLVDEADDLPADNVAWLVRESAWPIIEPQIPLRAELQRMVELYARHRPVSEGSKRVVIVGKSEVPINEPLIVLDSAISAPSSNEIKISKHPVTSGLSNGEISLKGIKIAAEPRGPDWASVVSVGGRTAVAVRTAFASQVWVGFESDDFSQCPDFVIFWANIFNWVGGGAEKYAAYPTGQLGSGWSVLDGAKERTDSGFWPGLYRSGEHLTRAINAPSVTLTPVQATDWVRELANLSFIAINRNGSGELAGGMIAAALGMLALAAATWVRRID
jgi:hypothetical protein